MKTFQQFREYLLEARKAVEQVVESVREQFYQGKIFNVGDIVEADDGAIYEITFRGANHLVLLGVETGESVRKFPDQLTPISEDQYGADFIYSQTKNKDGSRRKNHINRIEFSNSSMITKSKRIVTDTKRVQKPLTLKPEPIRNPYKNLIPDDNDRRSMKSFVRKLEKTAHPIPPKHHKSKKVDAGGQQGIASGGAPIKGTT